MKSFKKLIHSGNRGCWDESHCWCDTYEPLTIPDDAHPPIWVPTPTNMPIGDYSTGQFSASYVRCKHNREDRVQVDGNFPKRGEGIFVGIYDGHGGPWAVDYVCRNLLRRLKRGFPALGNVRDCDAIEQALRDAISQTEDAFIRSVRRVSPKTDPFKYTAGSCCLIGVLCRGMLYVANLGDSRAVLGYYNSAKELCARQLTNDHNVNVHEERKELMKEHKGDVTIVEKKDGLWFVKGRIQVTRSIGDLYLKDPEVQLKPPSKLNNPITKAVLRKDPAIFREPITGDDKFVIFASDGFWNMLSNVEAVAIVHYNSRRGIANYLIHEALMRHEEKKRRNNKEEEKRDQRPDDITVVVVFLGEGPAVNGRAIMGKFMDDLNPHEEDEEESPKPRKARSL